MICPLDHLDNNLSIHFSILEVFEDYIKYPNFNEKIKSYLINYFKRKNTAYGLFASEIIENHGLPNEIIIPFKCVYLLDLTHIVYGNIRTTYIYSSDDNIQLVWQRKK